MKKIILCFLVMLQAVTVFGGVCSTDTRSGKKVSEEKMSYSQLMSSLTGTVVGNICGFTLGNSHEYVQAILRKRKGTPADIAQNHILYKGVSYGRETFDNVSFFFQNDKYESDYYLNRIVFTKTARTSEEAELIKEALREKICWAYSSVIDMERKPLPAANPVEDSLSSEEEIGYNIKIKSPEKAGELYSVRIIFGINNNL